MDLKITGFFLALLATVAGAVLINPEALKGSDPARPVIKKSVLTAHINSVRESAGMVGSHLTPDPALSQWLEQQLAPQAKIADYAAETLLYQAKLAFPDLASFWVGVFPVPSHDRSFLDKMDIWEEATKEAYTHLALAMREEAEKEIMHVWVVLAQRFPDFAPNLLTGERQQFHHQCARCRKTYNGQFAGSDRILLLRCPHCDQAYDILAVGTAGRYARVNQFMDALEPEAAFKEGMTQLEELKLIWQSVLNHCQYTQDAEAPNNTVTKDYWQRSAETFTKQTGDCEDTSILLADWLISRGIDARVVIGETRLLLGHAWCVARVDGETYLLETTMSPEAATELVLADDTGDSYKPDYQFNRDHIYFRTGRKAWITDYWSRDRWLTVHYPAGDAVSKVSDAGASSTSTLGPWLASSAIELPSAVSASVGSEPDESSAVELSSHASESSP